MTTSRITLQDLKALPPTLTVEEAADLIGVGRTAAYEAVRQGLWPSVRVTARRIVVPTQPLLAMLYGTIKGGEADAC